VCSLVDVPSSADVLHAVASNQPVVDLSLLCVNSDGQETPCFGTRIQESSLLNTIPTQPDKFHTFRTYVARLR
jgi:hypothetical protein